MKIDPTGKEASQTEREVKRCFQKNPCISEVCTESSAVGKAEQQEEQHRGVQVSQSSHCGTEMMHNETRVRTQQMHAVRAPRCTLHGFVLWKGSTSTRSCT